MAIRRYLVVGTRPGSLGDAVAQQIEQSLLHLDMFRVYRADVKQTSGIDDYLDVCSLLSVKEVLAKVQPTDIVCCAGINLPDDYGAANMWRQLAVNAWGPMLLLSEALESWKGTFDRRGFCAVSSNSAHIARSQSAGYCASKAALSMALRCMARRMAGNNVLIWGYEPGWIDGTPMSEEVSERLGTDDPARLHRIPGGHGISKNGLALRIAEDVIRPMQGINGTMFRIDGGEA